MPSVAKKDYYRRALNHAIDTSGIMSEMGIKYMRLSSHEPVKQRTLTL